MHHSIIMLDIFESHNLKVRNRALSIRNYSTTGVYQILAVLLLVINRRTLCVYIHIVLCSCTFSCFKTDKKLT